ARYYEISYDRQNNKLEWAVREKRKQAAERLDGSYILKTNRPDLEADEIWRIYALLTRAENAFRNMKSPLAERPIFHQLADRVRAHIFLCVLAYHLLVAIEKTMQGAGIHTSWGSMREKLRTHQVVTLVLPLPDRRVLKLRKATTPEPEHVEIYNALGIPAEPMKPKKTWIRSI
ncbi:MAG TPA: transposase, partial [Firmicutes bacterium]|nr:transposase [Bacillota bacterium]